MLLFAGIFSEWNDPEHSGGFATDQRGKFVVHREHDLHTNVSGQQLFDHAQRYFKQQGAEVVTTGNQLRASGQVKLKQHAGVGNYVAGEVKYTVIVEEDNGEYRYWFTDFMYQPYVKDRYGKLVKANVKPIPMESQMSRLNQGLWQQQRRYAYNAIREVAADFEYQIGKVAIPSTVQTPVAQL